MRRTLLTALAAATLLGWGLPASVEAGGQTSGAAAGSTIADQSQGAAQPAAGTSGAPTGQVSDAELQAYMRVRQQLDYTMRNDPDFAKGMESGDLSARRAEIERALSALQAKSAQVAPVPSDQPATSTTATPRSPTTMTADEFMRIHRQVQSDPGLRSRVEAQLGAAGAPGTTGVPGTTGAGAPETTGAEPPGTTPGSPPPGPATPGAQPGASPQ